MTDKEARMEAVKAEAQERAGVLANKDMKHLNESAH